jgi:hypothetical protein
MKRMLSAVLTGCAALALLVVVQACGVLGGPPTGVAVSAGPGESDSTVLVSWTTPAEGAPDKYEVYFRPSTDTGYAIVGDTTATSFAHNPHGVTGQYKVAAVFGQDSYFGAEKPSTVPVWSEAALFEINTDSIHCGFGWSRDSGIGMVYSMIDSANCAFVDLYVSDLGAGTGGVLKIVSPNKAHPDTGTSIDTGAFGIVPRAAWKANGFSNLVSAETVPSYKAPPNETYFIYTQVEQPCLFGAYTANDELKHYAFIKVDSVNAAAGRVWLQTWFQLVPDLRLIRPD